jgi:hypothetical protein
LSNLPSGLGQMKINLVPSDELVIHSNNINLIGPDHLIVEVLNSSTVKMIKLAETKTSIPIAPGLQN